MLRTGKSNLFISLFYALEKLFLCMIYLRHIKINVNWNKQCKFLKDFWKKQCKKIYWNDCLYVGTDPSVKIVKECNATCRLYLIWNKRKCGKELSPHSFIFSLIRFRQRAVPGPAQVHISILPIEEIFSKFFLELINNWNMFNS